MGQIIYRVAARIRVELESLKQREIVLKALKPEALTTSKVNVEILSEGENALILKVTAKDLIKLRAVMNAYLRWIKTVSEVVNLTGVNKP
ncbi:MAG: KEOPS complex subunit Pcc1 [Candidatus Nezhaarchaeales archaeon]